MAPDVEVRIRAIAAVAHVWLQPASPWMRRAMKQLSRNSLWSVPMIRVCLQTTFAGYEDETALSRWVRSEGGRQRRCSPGDVWILCPSTVFAAMWQASTAAWLAGHRVILKPSRHEPVFAKLLAESVRRVVGSCLPMEIRMRLPHRHFAATRWVVYGRDETLEALRRQPWMRRNMIGFGSRLSVAVVGWHPARKGLSELCRKAARDVVLYDTQGCLSPQAFFVKEGRGVTAAAFAWRLAQAMEALDRKLPRRADDALEAESFWQRWKFRASQGSARIFRDRVVLQKDFLFEPCGLRRVVFVIPFRSVAELRKQIKPWRSKLSTVALADPSSAARWKKGVGSDPAIRWCVIGEMHQPPPSWRNGGVALIKALRG